MWRQYHDDDDNDDGDVSGFVDYVLRRAFSQLTRGPSDVERTSRGESCSLQKKSCEEFDTHYL